MPRYLILLLVVFGFARAAGAATLPSYDTDSLVYLSSDIIEGNLLRRYERDQFQLAEVQVSAVHKGNFKVGQKVAVLNFYLYMKDDIAAQAAARTDDERAVADRKLVPLDIGDNLFLFLSPPPENSIYPAGIALHCPIASGVAVVERGRVAGFAQGDNPGPYVGGRVPQTSKISDLYFPTLAAYRREVAASVPRMAALAAKLAQRESRADSAWVLPLLRGRARNDNWAERDHVAEVLSLRLVATGDLDAIDEALRLRYNYNTLQVLERVFTTVAGREYLLTKIAGSAGAERVRGARLLLDTSWPWGPELPQPSPDLPPAQTGSGPYATRLARLALDNRTDEALCVTLLRIINGVAQTLKADNANPRAATPEQAADWETAAPLLTQLYTGGASEKVKFYVERAMLGHSRAAYNALHSPCGPIPALVSRTDLKRHGITHEPDTLRLNFDIVITDALPGTKPEIVLTRHGGGGQYVFPLHEDYAFHLPNHFVQSEGYAIHIHPKFKRGDYRVHLQFKRGV